MNGVFFGKMNLEIKATIFWPCQKTLEEHSAFFTGISALQGEIICCTKKTFFKIGHNKSWKKQDYDPVFSGILIGMK